VVLFPSPGVRVSVVEVNEKLSVRCRIKPWSVKAVMSASVAGLPAELAEASLHPETALTVPPANVRVSVLALSE
jgi:hypothetical protein